MINHKKERMTSVVLSYYNGRSLTHVIISDVREVLGEGFKSVSDYDKIEIIQTIFILIYNERVSLKWKI